LADYYRQMGWDENGRPRDDTLHFLGLTDFQEPSSGGGRNPRVASASPLAAEDG
jgi:hypothetical protein